MCCTSDAYDKEMDQTLFYSGSTINSYYSFCTVKLGKQKSEILLFMQPIPLTVEMKAVGSYKLAKHMSTK